MDLESFNRAKIQSTTMRLVTVSTSVVPICRADARRVGLIISASQSTSMTFGIDSSIAAGNGLCVGANQYPLQFSAATDGGACQAQWFAVGNAGSSVIAVIETWDSGIPVQKG